MRASREASMAIVLLLAAGSVMSAHRRDEYLQAARIAVALERVDVSLDLTPGIALAERVIDDIDRDRNGTASGDEQAAYARRVLTALSIGVDGAPLAADIRSLSFPSFESLRRGEGAIRYRIAAPLPSLSAGAHQIVFRNNHEPDVSVYLANALVPETDRVAITGQRRDAAQRALAISFQLQASPMGRLWGWEGGLAILSVLIGVGVSRRRRLRRPGITADAGSAPILPALLRTRTAR